MDAKKELLSRYPNVNIKTLVADLSSKACFSATKALASLEVIDVIVTMQGHLFREAFWKKRKGHLHLIETNLYSAYYLTRGLINKVKNLKVTFLTCVQ